MSKGSTTRPMDRKKFEQGYERIFGKRKVNIHSSGKRELLGNKGEYIAHGYNPLHYRIYVPRKKEKLDGEEEGSQD